MRERLRRVGYRPALCYFEIGRGDTARMTQFAREEVTPLVNVSFAGAGAQTRNLASKLATKILSNVGDAEMQPLRHGLGLSPAAFEEGLFCWKGFIYYKWMLQDLAPGIRAVSAEIGAARAADNPGLDEKAYLAAVARRLTRGIAVACRNVQATLNIYERAYGALCQGGKPMAFRDFLLEAPALFHQLGERLGAVQHIVSFWRYRFPDGGSIKVPTEELIDLFADFETSIAMDALPAAAA
jgi:hypothetical protein